MCKPFGKRERCFLKQREKQKNAKKIICSFPREEACKFVMEDKLDKTFPREKRQILLSFIVHVIKQYLIDALKHF